MRAIRIYSITKAAFRPSTRSVAFLLRLVSLDSREFLRGKAPCAWPGSDVHWGATREPGAWN